MRHHALKALVLALLAMASVRSAHAIDQNNNGISDVWEAAYPSVMNSLATDHDGDGQTSAQEGIAGTNPLDPDDCLRVTELIRGEDGSSVSITFRSMIDRHYEIEESDDLIAWQHAVDIYGEINSTVATVYVDSNATRKFFRVKLHPEFSYDYDGDGLSSWEEVLLGTNRYTKDSESDGMADGYEFIHHLDPLANDSAADSDGDGLSNLWEFRLGLNPRLTDSDGNGVADSLEDRDSDSLTNISEVTTHSTDPGQPDTDMDTLGDGWEQTYGMNPLVNNLTDGNPANDPDADPDEDGLTNTEEEQNNTNPNKKDTDNDGVNDKE